jgi:hypothetical protein
MINQAKKQGKAFKEYRMTYSRRIYLGKISVGDNTVKTKTNKLTYMQSSITYLNQRSFEPFIELIKEGAKIEESTKPVGGVDI